MTFPIAKPRNFLEAMPMIRKELTIIPPLKDQGRIWGFGVFSFFGKR
jgi:hypothetical protein